jgi:hypothetical protein
MVRNPRSSAPEVAVHQAALSRIAVKGRSALRAEGMSDAEIDAAIDELVGKLGPPKPKPGARV